MTHQYSTVSTFVRALDRYLTAIEIEKKTGKLTSPLILTGVHSTIITLISLVATVKADSYYGLFQDSN